MFDDDTWKAKDTIAIHKLQLIVQLREFTYYHCKEQNHLDIKGPFGYRWKLKTETEKYCSKIIFKCVNNTVGPIFNKKVAEKWNLWIRE